MRAARPTRLRILAPLLALALVGQSGFLIGHVRSTGDLGTPAAAWAESTAVIDAAHVDCPVCRALAQARTALTAGSTRAGGASVSVARLTPAALPAPPATPLLDGERARAPPRSA